MAKYLLTLLWMVLKSSVSLRGAFLLQALFMALNNLLFFVVWWVLFERFEQIRGYRMPDMLLLYGVSCAGFGLAVLVCGGLRELAARISDGELDGLLTQPKSVLLRALMSRSWAAGWGDLISGALLLAFALPADPLRLSATLLAVVCSASVVVASAVLFQASAFWLGRTESAARSAFEFTLAFSLYPPTLFGPQLKVVLFTLIPAGLLAYLPCELVRDPSLVTASLVCASALLYCAFAVGVFQRGLRHYASGNHLTIWG
ncbi:MAG TPA: ABC-2 family transporter protein [Polyangiales bacterium]